MKADYGLGVANCIKNETIIVLYFLLSPLEHFNTAAQSQFQFAEA
jgi:hypothetical protein